MSQEPARFREGAERETRPKKSASRGLLESHHRPVAILSLAVYVNDAVTQMNAVAGLANQPLYQNQILRISFRIRISDGLDEDHDVSTLWLAGSGPAASIWRAERG